MVLSSEIYGHERSDGAGDGAWWKYWSDPSPQDINPLCFYLLLPGKAPLMLEITCVDLVPYFEGV